MATDPLRDQAMRAAIVALVEKPRRAKPAVPSPIVVSGPVVQLAPDVESGPVRARKSVARLASNGRWYLWGEPTRGLAYPRTHVRIRGRRAGTPQRVRPHSLNLRRMPRSMAEALAAEYPPEVNAEHAAERPRTWGDCTTQGLARPGNPCPWVSCKYHLYLDVNPRGNIRLAFPDREPWELEHSCALRVAADGGLTLEQTGAAFNVTRERVRQIEDRTLGRLRRHLPIYQELAADTHADHWSDVLETGAGWYARSKS